MSRLLLSLLLALTALACGDDTSLGFRGECASAGGQLGCEPEPASTSKEACWKLVDCGLIPVQDEDNDFDWSGCTNEIDDMASERQSIVLRCIDASSCDDLRANPETGRGPASICGELGEQ